MEQWTVRLQNQFIIIIIYYIKWLLCTLIWKTQQVFSGIKSGKFTGMFQDERKTECMHIIKAWRMYGKIGVLILFLCVCVRACMRACTFVYMYI